MNNLVSTYSIGETAKKLGVSKKTLMRWDDIGKFPSIRDDNNYRRYDMKIVDGHVLWFDLRRKHKEHLRTLKPIREEVDKFVRTKPLSANNPPRVFNFNDMKRAYEKLTEWEAKEKEIMREYGNLPKGFVNLVDPEI